jgi:hypothetical protein
VLAHIGKDGKLVIKSTPLAFAPAQPPLPHARPGAPPRAVRRFGGGGAAIPGAEVKPVLGVRTYDLDDVKVLNTRGKAVSKKEVLKRLKAETVALASLHGQEVDPLQLRVYKDGRLLFVLPPPGIGGGGGGSSGGAPPAPATPASTQSTAEAATSSSGSAPPAAPPPEKD